MTKTKSILLPLTACMLLLTLTGCQHETATPDINTYHETIDPPADGWTDADIEKVLYINGKQISFPFTLDELGEGFTWDLEYANFYSDPERASYVPILYDGTNFALAFVYATDESQLQDAPIVALSYDNLSGVEESAHCMPNLLYFNGITLNSEGEKAKQVCGSDSFIRSETYTIFCGDSDHGVDHIFIIKNDELNLEDKK